MKFPLVFVGILVLAFFVLIWQGIFLPSNYALKSNQELVIKQGEGLQEIARDLKKAGLIQSTPLFEAYVVLAGKHNKLKAGLYYLGPGNNIPDILNILVSGKTAKTKITIIEGWDLEDIANYLESRGFFSKQDFLVQTEKMNLEGYLFPDTYELAFPITPEIIIEKMLANLQSKMQEYDKELIGPGLNQILTMASLLEKEVKTEQDKQIVSGILWKRLESNWPLQVDATLTYILEKTSGQLTKEDLNIDSKYNTYKYKGLPPGPICNPGLDSIKAALYPEKSPYWFYLSAPDGKTIFSRTLDEHNAAKVKYLGL